MYTYAHSKLSLSALQRNVSATVILHSQISSQQTFENLYLPTSHCRFLILTFKCCIVISRAASPSAALPISVCIIVCLHLCVNIHVYTYLYIYIYIYIHIFTAPPRPLPRCLSQSASLYIYLYA